MQFITEEEVSKLRGSSSIKEATLAINEVLVRVYNKAVEEALSKSPDLMLRLLVSQQAQQKSAKDFYDRNPGFKEHRDIVQTTVQMVEAENPGKDYSFILGLSEPMIKQKISKLAELKKLPLDRPEAFNPNGTDIL